MKTQLKVSIVLGFVLVVIVVLFGYTIYYVLNEYSYIDFYKRLETRASLSARYNLEPHNAENIKLWKKQHLEKLEQERDYLVELTPATTIDYLSATYGLSHKFLETLFAEGKSREKKGNTFYVGSRVEKASKRYVVIVSAENYYVSHHLIFLRNVLIGGVVFVITIVICLSFYFSRQIFFPIRKIVNQVKQISTENIHLRVDNNNPNNAEISELISTFNDLLNRIETAFETQKNFISNASHELGTPLTSIIGEADVSLLKKRSTEEYEKALQNILDQAERLDQITKSLLFLAQTGYKGKAIIFERIRIDEVIWETKAIIDKLNPDNKIMVDLSLLPEDPNKLKVKGNRQLLQLAFANILTNACKYSNNEPTQVYIASSNSQIVITIKDQGIGIPENELPFIYDPFFRASNVNLYEGYGIGLPLSRNVIRLHNGTLLVTSKLNAGTTVQVRLPLMK